MCGQSTLEEQAVDSVMEQLDIALPDGLQLDTRRVGEHVTYADELNPGETVSFIYSAGSEVSDRTVLVVKVDGTGLEGLTLERDGGYRRYLDDFITSDISIVKPFVKSGNSPYHSNNTEKRVRFDDAGTALLASLSGEQLADLYGQYVAVEGVGTIFDAKTGEVVVKLPEPESRVSDVILGDSFSSITLSNKHGKYLSLFFYDDKSIGVQYNAGSKFVSVEGLRDELTKFLA